MSNTNPTPSWGQNNPGGTGQWQQPGNFPPPPPPKKRNIWKAGCLGCGGLLAVGAVIGIAVAVSSGSSSSGASASKNNGTLTSSNNGAHPPQKDVRITACTVDDLTNFPSAKVTITNHSSKPSDYNVHVEFLDAHGARIDDGYDPETDVRPGQTVYGQASGLKQSPGKVTCHVVSVDRFASGN